MCLDDPTSEKSNCQWIKNAWIEKIDSCEETRSKTITVDEKRIKDFHQMMRNTPSFCLNMGTGEFIPIESDNQFNLRQAEINEDFEKCAEIRDDIIDYKIKTGLLK